MSVALEVKPTAKECCAYGLLFEKSGTKANLEFEKWLAAVRGVLVFRWDIPFSEHEIDRGYWKQRYREARTPYDAIMETPANEI